MTTEEQHIEELLKPRIKVIAGTPYSGSLEVGEIVYADKDGKYYVYEDKGRWELHPDGYPHLFRKLSWWEDRKPEDMPLYVSYKFMEHSKSKWFKVKRHFQNSFGESNKYGFIANKDYYSYSKSLPATESEYLTYKSKQ